MTCLILFKRASVQTSLPEKPTEQTFPLPKGSATVNLNKPKKLDQLMSYVKQFVTAEKEIPEPLAWEIFSRWEECKEEFNAIDGARDWLPEAYKSLGQEEMVDGDAEQATDLITEAIGTKDVPPPVTDTSGTGATGDGAGAGDGANQVGPDAVPPQTRERAGSGAIRTVLGTPDAGFLASVNPTFASKTDADKASCLITPNRWMATRAILTITHGKEPMTQPQILSPGNGLFLQGGELKQLRHTPSGTLFTSLKGIEGLLR